MCFMVWYNGNLALDKFWKYPKSSLCKPCVYNRQLESSILGLQVLSHSSISQMPSFPHSAGHSSISSFSPAELQLQQNVEKFQHFMMHKAEQ